MAATLFDVEKPLTRAGIIPRPYQLESHDKTFELFDEGILGALERLATGTGKTLVASLIADTWLRRGDDYRFMVVSHEIQLVGQFADEIHDFLGVEPGIEMAEQTADASQKVVVVSRQTLLRAPAPDDKQIAELAEHGVHDLGACAKKVAERYLRHLRKGGDVDSVLADIAAVNSKPEACNGVWSRLHKFDWRLNWLLCFDEAHMYSHRLTSVGPIVDWFEQNPQSRRIGLTATPKRSDGVSIGHKMFPGVAVDYPLYSRSKPCAVKDGWAKPYVQRYIQVEGVDFKNLKRDSKGDFDGAAMEIALQAEGALAKLVMPLLDMVENRRTLIFSPGVDMARNVALFINARVKASCECGSLKWYPRALIGDGACCECGRFVEAGRVLTNDEQARQLDGSSPDSERKDVYHGHQNGRFQFLSVCGLCRAGYNDPEISCVAVFRPVSEKASALAEQMKGRGCRVSRELSRRLHTFATAEERVKAIAESAAPNALIIDLVGITGLADCASTVEIYADGVPDEIKKRAKEILAEQGEDKEADVEEAIVQAEREAEETKERVRLEREAAERHAREEFERRSKTDAQARYTSHEVGYGSNLDPDAASDGQYKFMRFLGMDIKTPMPRKKAGRIISQLKAGKKPPEIAYLNNLQADEYKPSSPSDGQLKYMRRLNVPTWPGMRPIDASFVIDASVSPADAVEKLLTWIGDSRTPEELTFAGYFAKITRTILPKEDADRVIEAGKKKRISLEGKPEPTPGTKPNWNDDMAPL